MKKLIPIVLLSILFSCEPKQKSAQQEPAATEIADASISSDSSYVFFKYPENGTTVASPVYIEMGVSGMQVEPAGEVREGFGHHHILLNQTSWPKGKVIPASDSTIHFGKGQTDASLELPAGEYTIALQFADGVHSSYGETLAATINITVE